MTESLGLVVALGVIIGGWMLLRSYRKFSLTPTHDDVVRYRLRCERAEWRRAIISHWLRPVRRVLRTIERAVLALPRWLIGALVGDLLKSWRHSSMRREIAWVGAALVLLAFGWISRTEFLVVVAFVLVKGVFDRLRDQRRAIAELRTELMEKRQ
jgi:hypothetical protein